MSTSASESSEESEPADPGFGDSGHDPASGLRITPDTPHTVVRRPYSGHLRRVEEPGSTPPLDSDHREVWALVEAVKTGDGPAFGRLYDRYYDVVYRYIIYRVGDKVLAEDLTSETFLRALRRITSVTYQGRDFGAWLVTIARNLVYDYSKSARFRLESVTDDIGLVSDRNDVGERPPTPETLALKAFTARRLMAAVDTLGSEQRECVVLRFVEGLSVAETAAIMGKKAGAIKALQHRAVRKLASILGPELEDELSGGSSRGSSDGSGFTL